MLEGKIQRNDGRYKKGGADRFIYFISKYKHGKQGGYERQIESPFYIKPQYKGV